MNLNTPIEKVNGIGAVNSKRLEKLGITTVWDFINHIPFRYEDFSSLKKTDEVVVGEIATIRGKISSLRNQVTKRGLRMQIGAVEDAKGKLPLVFFNQPFLIRMLYPGQRVSFSGKIQNFSGKPAIVSPEYEILKDDASSIHTGKIVPVYPETSGLSSKWLRTKMRSILGTVGSQIKEFLPQSDINKFKLEVLPKAYLDIHSPKKMANAEKARLRLAFNELLMLNIKSQMRRNDWQKENSTYTLVVNKKEVSKFVKSLPFTLTMSQKSAIEEIERDLVKSLPMNRLLEGDVGSGKTIVAAVAAFISFLNGHQSIFMAPTQILAKQHYETLKKLFDPYRIRVSLVTSATKKLELGRSDVFIGTHALIHKKLNLDKVSLVVIDEQHRFGVEQRQHLVKISKNKLLAPHVLTLTATPIPRTIVQTVHGDLDLSILREMPGGRKKVSTFLVPPTKRLDAYSWIKKEINKNKSQAFIVCPLIEESTIETMQDIKAVKTEFLNLKKVFPNFKLGLLHGKLKPKEKDEVLKHFKDKKIDILVSTPVVEVGIDIPNATIMVIETAERFGLAQLHQLRGRVGRGDKKSYCLLFSSINHSKRLTAVTKIHSGFELAELDLKLRGPGEVFGTKQHGFPDLKVADWSMTKLIKETKELAVAILENPKKYPKFNLYEVVDKTQPLV